MVRKKKKAAADDAPLEGSAQEGAESGASAATSTEDEGRDLTPEEHIQVLLDKVEDLNGRWMRAQADYQNQRRRAHADLESGIKRHISPLLEELLFVLDFLDMALASPATNDETKNLVMGVQMTRTKFVQALENANVREIPTDGAFDPALHDATEVRETEDAEPGAIVATMRKGYTWKDHVLRHAQVAVAPSAADSEAESGSDEEAVEGDSA